MISTEIPSSNIINAMIRDALTNYPTKKDVDDAMKLKIDTNIDSRGRINLNNAIRLNAPLIVNTPEGGLFNGEIDNPYATEGKARAIASEMADYVVNLHNNNLHSAHQRLFSLKQYKLKAGANITLTQIELTPNGESVLIDATQPDLTPYAKKADTPYSLVEATINEGSVILQDRAITKVEVDDSISSIVFTFPNKVKGKARDFFIRLVITGETVPTLEFVEPNGDEVSFDVDDNSWAEIERGVNILMFTDTEE